MMIREMVVHFFNLLSMDLPLFLPKKVSEEPVMELIPSELLGCINTKTIETMDKSKIIIVIVMQSAK